MPRKKSGLFDQKEYVNRYHRENIARKNVTFNRGKPEDMALLEWAESKPEGFVAYVKHLIRDDMGEGCISCKWYHSNVRICSLLGTGDVYDDFRCSGYKKK